MAFVRPQTAETGKVYNFVVEALTITVVALAGFLGFVTLATA